MKIGVLLFFVLSCGPLLAGTPDISIPEHDADLIKTADCLEVSGTNELGGAENFTIHDRKAIVQFVDLLTSERFTAVPKSLKPHFKSLASYQIRLFARNIPAFKLQVIAESVLDIPGDSLFYMESDRYSENLMAPLLRLR